MSREPLTSSVFPSAAQQHRLSLHSELTAPADWHACGPCSFTLARPFTNVSFYEAINYLKLDEKSSLTYVSTSFGEGQMWWSLDGSSWGVPYLCFHTVHPIYTDRYVACTYQAGFSVPLLLSHKVHILGSCLIINFRNKDD